MNENSKKIILHLCCSEFGSDTRDYKEAGYDVRYVDKNVDVRTYEPPENVYGIFANPPCTMFSKARTTAKTPRDMMQGMELVQACLKIIWKCQSRITRDANPEMPLKFWVIENPGSGYLKWFLGKPAYTYQPYEFGANKSKETALWGIFNPPLKNLLIQHSLSRSVIGKNTETISHNSDVRSIACPEFTKAFFMANP